MIGDVISYPAGDHLAAERVNRYITGGEVRLANLAEPGLELGGSQARGRAHLVRDEGVAGSNPATPTST